MAAHVLCVVVLYAALPVPPSSYGALDLYSDNEGLVTTITEMIQWEHHYPSNALLSEWDILSVILAYLPRLPMSPNIKHVLGHQDKHDPISSLPLAAQLNCKADALATAALEAIPSPIPLPAVFPTAQYQLDVGDATASRHLSSTLRHAAAAPDMINYLKERNNWDDAAYESVSWPAFASAQSQAVDPQFIPKFTHRHLLVGVKANRNDSKYSPA
jgi:hypothetical protein